MGYDVRSFAYYNVTKLLFSLKLVYFRKVDEWELGDKQLEVFEDKELGRGAFGIVYEGKLYGDRPVDKLVRSTVTVTEEIKSKVSRSSNFMWASTSVLPFTALSFICRWL